MACGNNNQQQTQQNQPVQYSNQTTNGQPPMSLINGGTNAIPIQNQAQQPVTPQVMAQQAAAMPTANQNSSGVTDGIMPDGSYNAKYDQTINQIAGRMQALQQSGAFKTPYQQSQQKHPLINALASAGRTFGQGLTHQPFETSNNENQTALQNTQEQNSAQLMSPTNMMNMMFMKQMMGGGQPQPTQAKPIDFTNPSIMASVRAAAPKGATHFSPTIGYTDDQGNPVK